LKEEKKGKKEVEGGGECSCSWHWLSHFKREEKKAGKRKKEKKREEGGKAPIRPPL